MEWMTQASTSAQKADAVFFFVFALSVVFLVGITAVMIYFVIRYSKKRHPKAEQIEGHTGLEIVWTVVPLVLFLAIFYYGWTNYSYMRNAPRDAMVVKVLGRQWNWSFEYPNGKQTTVLYAALGKPMKLEIRSRGRDPRLLRARLPAQDGRRPRPRQHHLVRAHPARLLRHRMHGHLRRETTRLMLSKVVVVPEEEFKAWYFGDENAPEPGGKFLAEQAKPAPGGGGSADPPGLVVLKAKNCLSCHSIDGKPMVGPTFKGLFGSEETLVADGGERKAKVDEAFLEKAIQEPMADRVKGYPPTMPPNPLTPKELLEVFDYMRSLK